MLSMLLAIASPHCPQVSSLQHILQEQPSPSRQSNVNIFHIKFYKLQKLICWYQSFFLIVLFLKMYHQVPRASDPKRTSVPSSNPMRLKTNSWLRCHQGGPVSKHIHFDGVISRIRNMKAGQMVSFLNDIFVPSHLMGEKRHWTRSNWARKVRAKDMGDMGDHVHHVHVLN